MTYYSNHSRRSHFEGRIAESLRGQFAAQARGGVEFGHPRFESFKTVQPSVAAWIEAKAETFDFAVSMYWAVVRYGDLTPGQYAAVERCMGRDQERALGAGNGPQNVTVDAARIRAAFETARSSGLRRVKVSVAGFDLSLAPDHGKNPGAIYVKDGSEYVGKVVGNDFQPTRSFQGERAETLQAVFADPAAAARLHGQRTGNCSCCGRTLTDPESIRKGIGPICEGRFGWAGF